MTPSDATKLVQEAASRRVQLQRGVIAHAIDRYERLVLMGKIPPETADVLRAALQIVHDTASDASTSNIPQRPVPGISLDGPADFFAAGMESVTPADANLNGGSSKNQNGSSSNPAKECAAGLAPLVRVAPVSTHATLSSSHAQNLASLTTRSGRVVMGTKSHPSVINSNGVMFELTHHRLIPSTYTIRLVTTDNINPLLHWALEASVDGNSWVRLDEVRAEDSRGQTILARPIPLHVLERSSVLLARQSGSDVTLVQPLSRDSDTKLDDLVNEHMRSCSRLSVSEGGTRTLGSLQADPATISHLVATKPDMKGLRPTSVTDWQGDPNFTTFQVMGSGIWSNDPSRGPGPEVGGVERHQHLVNTSHFIRNRYAGRALLATFEGTRPKMIAKALPIASPAGITLPAFSYFRIVPLSSASNPFVMSSVEFFGTLTPRPQATRSPKFAIVEVLASDPKKLDELFAKPLKAKLPRILVDPSQREQPSDAAKESVDSLPLAKLQPAKLIDSAPGLLSPPSAMPICSEEEDRAMLQRASTLSIPELIDLAARIGARAALARASQGTQHPQAAPEIPATLSRQRSSAKVVPFSVENNESLERLVQRIRGELETPYSHFSSTRFVNRYGAVSSFATGMAVMGEPGDARDHPLLRSAILNPNLDQVRDLLASSDSTKSADFSPAPPPTTLTRQSSSRGGRRSNGRRSMFYDASQERVSPDVASAISSFLPNTPLGSQPTLRSVLLPTFVSGEVAPSRQLMNRYSLTVEDSHAMIPGEDVAYYPVGVASFATELDFIASLAGTCLRTSMARHPAFPALNPGTSCNFCGSNGATKYSMDGEVEMCSNCVVYATSMGSQLLSEVIARNEAQVLALAQMSMHAYKDTSTEQYVIPQVESMENAVKRSPELLTQYLMMRLLGKSGPDAVDLQHPNSAAEDALAAADEAHALECKSEASTPRAGLYVAAVTLFGRIGTITSFEKLRSILAPFLQLKSESKPTQEVEEALKAIIDKMKPEWDKFTYRDFGHVLEQLFLQCSSKLQDAGVRLAAWLEAHNIDWDGYSLGIPSSAVLAGRQPSTDIERDPDDVLGERVLTAWSGPDAIDFDRDIVSLITRIGDKCGECMLAALDGSLVTPSRADLDLLPAMGHRKLRLASLTSPGSFVEVSFAHPWAVEVVRVRFALLRVFNRILTEILPFIDVSDLHPGSCAALVRQCRPATFYSVLSEYADRLLELSAVAPERVLEVSVDRLNLAMRLDKGLKINFAQHTGVGAAAQILATASGPLLRPPRPHGADPFVAFHLKFLNEHAVGQAGPYRQFFLDAAVELTNPKYNCPLFTPTSTSRDRYTIRPSASSPQDLTLCEVVGVLFGCCVRTGVKLPIQLTSFFWKALVGVPLNVNDLNNVDKHFVTRMKDILTFKREYEESRKASENPEQEGQVASSLDIPPERDGDDYTESEEEDDLDIEEKFARRFPFMMNVTLSDSSVVELVPGGSSIPVTLDNCEEYVRLAIAARLREHQLQIQAMRRGLAKTIPMQILQLVKWSDFESMVCGHPEIDIALLRRNTKYSEGVDPNAPYITWLWEILEEFDNETRRSFIRFTWAQDSIPADDEEFRRSHTRLMIKPATARSTSPDKLLPRADTCFFNLELPAYTSKSHMRERLLFAISSGNDMNGDVIVQDN